MKKIHFYILLICALAIFPLIASAVGYTLYSQTGVVPNAGNYPFSVSGSSTFSVSAGTGNARNVIFSADGYARYTMPVNNGEFHYQNGYVNGDTADDSNSNMYPTDGFRIAGHFTDPNGANGTISYVYNGKILSGSPKTFTAGVINQPPVGSFDGVLNGVAGGWAVDPDVPGASINIDVYIDGTIATGTILNEITANSPSPDVTAAYPAYTGNHRFAYTISAKYADGKSHKLYMYAIDSAGGRNPLLPGSPKTFTIAKPALKTITLFPLTASLTVGGATKQLTATTLDQNNNPIAATLTWTSSNISVAKVSSTGLVTPVRAGIASITAFRGSVRSAPSVITVSAKK